MDQDYFRKLLATSSSGSPSASRKQRNFLPTSGWGIGRNKKQPIPKNNETPQVAFQPRKVKQKEEDQDRPPKINLEEYAQLGSAKGLDMSLLDRNRYLEDTGAVDDDELEQAFASTGRGNKGDVDASDLPESSLPQKRTREDIINDMKRKRAKQDEPDTTTPTSAESRFKPIGRPAVQNQKKMKKVSKKKAQESVPTQLTPDPSIAVLNEPILKPSPPTQQERVPDEDPVEDIFEGVDDYDGLGEDDVSSSESEKPPGAGSMDSPFPPNEHKPQRTNWFDDPDQEEDTPMSEQPPLPPADSAEKGKARMQSPEEAPPTRLQPLASSKIRSISEYLDIQKSLEEEEKRTARREKRKGKKKE